MKLVNKIKALKLIVLIACCVFVYDFFIKESQVGFSDIKLAYSEFRESKVYTSDTYDTENVGLREQLVATNNTVSNLMNEKTKLDTEFDRLLKESKLNNYFELDEADLIGIMYGIKTDSSIKVGKFYSYGDNTFTVNVNGTLSGIKKYLNGFTEKLVGSNYSIGNLSIRQDYEVYDLSRLYDNNTELVWFSGKLVNSKGEIVNINKLMDTESIKTSEKTEVVSNDTAEKGSSTLKEIRESKLIEEYKNLEIDQKAIDDETSKLREDAEKQLRRLFEKRDTDIKNINNSSLSQAEKTSKVSAIQSEFVTSKTKIEKKYGDDVTNIYNKYIRYYNNDKKLITDELGYDPEVKEAKEAKKSTNNVASDTVDRNPSNPSKLNYKCDITIKLVDEEDIVNNTSGENEIDSKNELESTNGVAKAE